MKNGKALALDFGTKSIGYAVSDEARTIAFPRGAFRNAAGIFEEIAALCIEEKIKEIVIGRPETADGKESVQTRQAVAFGNRLALSTQLPIHFHDERFTTERARKYMKRFHGKANLDAVAASLILEEYLELL